ncbi:MAG TPA: ribose-phosphate diphosphokinase [Gammaproteobacteria bacterium]|nr:ribose-phosphate diphosphokinase [Gammaproteobacteria bacterium]
MTTDTRAGLLLGFPEYREQARALAAAAGLVYADVRIHHFPDGESRVQLPPQLPAEVTLCRSLDHPNARLVELELAAATALQLGARQLTLVAPYLCYMRQDIAFHPGEAVSQRIVGELLARRFHTLITVDPHLHRVHRLDQAVPVPRAVSLSAYRAMADFLLQRFDRPFLVGPDAESEQWVRAIAAVHGFDYRVARKERRGDRDVRIRLPAGDYGDRQLVLVDDVASTGRTLEQTALQLRAHRPASISVLVTHALFVDDALERLRRAGIDRVYSSDSVPHPSNRLPLASLLAGALSQTAGPAAETEKTQ